MARVINSLLESRESLVFILVASSGEAEKVSHPKGPKQSGGVGAQSSECRLDGPLERSIFHQDENKAGAVASLIFKSDNQRLLGRAGNISGSSTARLKIHSITSSSMLTPRAAASMASRRSRSSGRVIVMTLGGLRKALKNIDRGLQSLESLFA